MRLGLFQIDSVWEDKEANLSKLRSIRAEILSKRVNVLILPEMFATGFTMNTSVTMEDLEGKTISFLQNFAQKDGLWIIAGMVLKGEGGKGKNSAVIIDKLGNLKGVYVKTKLFSYQDEHLYHEPGSGPSVFDIDGVRTALFICYDLRFPELFRKVAKESELMVVIASWPELRQAHWDTLLRARAIENQCYVAGVNRVGEGGGLSFGGGSTVYDPFGNPLLVDNGKEELLVCNVYPSLVKQVRAQYPFLE